MRTEKEPARLPPMQAPKQKIHSFIIKHFGGFVNMEIKKIVRSVLRCCDMGGINNAI